MTISPIPALKEWAIAVDALTRGDTVLLLRKGGIRETAGQFTVAHRHIWLYPTYEHQKPHLLKPTYAQQVNPVASGWHPDRVVISAWAMITHIIPVTDARAIASLTPFHIWNEQFVTERLHWKPRQPLYLLVLRVYRLPTSVALPYRADYGGCQSWIELIPDAETVDVGGDRFPLSAPVLSEEAYQQQVAAIHHHIRSPANP